MRNLFGDEAVESLRIQLGSAFGTQYKVVVIIQHERDWLTYDTKGHPEDDIACNLALDFLIQPFCAPHHRHLHAPIVLKNSITSASLGGQSDDHHSRIDLTRTSILVTSRLKGLCQECQAQMVL